MVVTYLSSDDIKHILRYQEQAGLRQSSKSAASSALIINISKHIILHSVFV